MAINPDQFAKIAESLRQYRRAELSDFQSDVGDNPVELLYVDPLESDAVLKTVLLNDLPPDFSPIVMRHSPGLGFRA
jgi:hypothetical protein